MICRLQVRRGHTDLHIQLFLSLKMIILEFIVELLQSLEIFDRSSQFVDALGKARQRADLSMSPLTSFIRRFRSVSCSSISSAPIASSSWILRFSTCASALTNFASDSSKRPFHVIRGNSNGSTRARARLISSCELSSLSKFASFTL